MPNALYNTLNNSTNNTLLNNIKRFRSDFPGDPKQMVMNLINTGKITQAQVNRYAQQANELYRMFR